MHTISLSVVAIVLLLPRVSLAQADDLKKQIVGKWEATLKDAANTEFKLTTEFKADGKMEVIVKGVKVPGTWKIVDEKFIETETNLDGNIKKAKQEAKVVDDTLELKDAEGKTFKFKRPK